MTAITFMGRAIHTSGHLPAVGSMAPDFTATDAALNNISLSQFKGKKVVLNIFPSLDTSTCAQSVIAFNKFAAVRNDIVVLCISMDLPFAQKRFCEQANINNIVGLSVFRSPEFGKSYGVIITDGALHGLCSRAVVLIDEEGKILYTEQVSEITHEPNYETVKKLVGQAAQLLS